MNTKTKQKGVESYSWKHICTDFADILTHHGIESAIFVGHDWGGMAVWRMALHFPERVSAVAALLTPYQPPSAEYVSIDQVCLTSPLYHCFLLSTLFSSYNFLFWLTTLTCCWIQVVKLLPQFYYQG